MILQCFKSGTSEVSQITATKKIQIEYQEFYPRSYMKPELERKLNTISQAKGLTLMIKTGGTAYNSEMVFGQIFDETLGYTYRAFATAMSGGN